MRIGRSERHRVFARILMLSAGALIAATLAVRSSAAGYHETVLYSFCAQGGSGGSGSNCTDGDQPYAGLIMDASGNLYGTTFSGAPYNPTASGRVFELIPPAKGRIAWTYKVLYRFCAEDGIACTDGRGPFAGLIMDASGNLYGTTIGGGAHGGGAVFELIPPAKGKTAWAEKVLYSFCAQLSCPDGGEPYASLIMDASGNLYGTTSGGGTDSGRGLYGGTVFELIPPAKGNTAWTHKVLYSFCTAPTCTDGERPYAAVITDKQGNLYGTTSAGGAHRYGTVFELRPNATKTVWAHKVLYHFCAHGGGICTDGAAFPGEEAGLIMDASGNLYGTTALGGIYAPGFGSGTVFELTPNAAKTVWTYKVLYRFCSQGGEWCTDGAAPFAGLIIDKLGNLYGTTNAGGAYRDLGAAFELVPNAAKTAWTEKVLYSFCAAGTPICADGSVPSAGLIIDKSGNLYGTTSSGGAHGDARGLGGTVFGLKP